jgi:serine/threonine protein kinase
VSSELFDDHCPLAEPGDVLLGKYRVERTLGEGGMGVVFAVRHVELGELFAMKVLKRSALREVRGAERFAREARAVARLRSEHVAHVFDVGLLANGLPYMLLEYLEGRDLGTLLYEEGSLSAREAVDCILLALDAVIEAHDRGIVHRDLKPENLFLADRGDGSLTIKVLDFGISKDLKGDAGGSVTHTSNVMGSPFYMSPEQMRSAKHVDERTDLWALGVILFELLTSDVPFPGDTVTQVCANVIERPLPSIETLAPGTPRSLAAIVEKSLARNIDERFQSSRELAEALRLVGDELGDAPPGVSLDSVRRLFGKARTGGRKESDGHPTPRRTLAEAETLAPTPPPAEMPLAAAFSVPVASRRKGSSLIVLLMGLVLVSLGFLAVRAERTVRSTSASMPVESASRSELKPPFPASVAAAGVAPIVLQSADPAPKPQNTAPPKPRIVQAARKTTEVAAPAASTTQKKHEGIY